MQVSLGRSGWPLKSRNIGRLAAVACAIIGIATTSLGQSVSKLSLSPASVVGGTSSTATVTLSAKAGSNGAVVTLSSSSSSATVESSVTVAAGKTSASFPVSTIPVPVNATVTIKAMAGSKSVSSTLTIKAPTLSTLSVSPSSLIGGNSAIGTVTSSSIAPTGGLTVKLTSSVKTASTPASVIIPALATSATFTITTEPVTAKTAATLTAKLGTKSTTVTLTLTPAPANKYAGSYSGSFYSTGQSQGTCTFTIASSGAVSGTAYDYKSTPAHKVSISGTVSGAGVANISTTGSSGTSSSKGTAVFNKNGDLSLSLQDNGDNTVTTVTANTAGKPLEYAGTYTGTLLSSDGSSGTISMKITSTGVLSGSGQIGTSSFTLSGKVSVTGVANTNEFYLAFDGSGQLMMFVINSGGTTTTGTLSLVAGGSINP